MEPSAHRYLCPILLPILWLLLQQTKCNFPCVYPTWTQIWPLNFPGPFWPFLSCSGCLRQALPLPPMFSTFCTFSTFPLAIFPVQSSVFSSSWGFTDAHVHFTHFEASKPSEEKQQFGSPWAITRGWSWPKRVCVHVWKGERALTSSGCIQDKTVTHCQKPVALPTWGIPISNLCR